MSKTKPLARYYQAREFNAGLRKELRAMRKKVTIVGPGNVGATTAHWIAAKEQAALQKSADSVKELCAVIGVA